MLPTKVSILQKPWTAGLFSWRPECSLCTWVWLEGRFKLKFVNAACREHAHLLGGAS